LWGIREFAESLAFLSPVASLREDERISLDLADASGVCFAALEVFRSDAV